MKKTILTILLIATVCSELYINTSVSSKEDLYAVIYGALQNCEEQIDLTGTECDGDEFVRCYAHILNDIPEFFYVGRSVNYVTGTNGRVISATPEYIMSLDEIEIGREVCKKWIKQTLFLLDDGMTDYDKLLFLHDYICANFEYDLTCTNDDLYRFVRDRIGNCRSYTMAYSALLRQAGINATYAASESMAHIWNLVELDGQYYHADLTWDDLPGKTFAALSHENFLLDDGGIKQAGHYGWQNYENIVCTSVKYACTSLQNIKGSMAYLDGEWYCTGQGLYKFDVDRDLLTLVYKAENVLSVVSVEGRIAFCADGGLLFSDGERAVTSGTVCGIRAHEGYVEYAIEEFGSGRVPYSSLRISRSSYGDVNGDGEVNALDVILCNLCFSGELAEGLKIYKNAADLDRDGDIDKSDISLLRGIVVKKTGVVFSGSD